VNSCLRCHVHSEGCCRLQNGGQLHYHAADSVLTCGWAFISQQIGKKIFIALAIFDICVKIEKSSAGKRSMYIHISRGHTFWFRTLKCLTLIKWRRRRSWPRWRRSSWRCICAFVHPASLWILCFGIMEGRQASVPLSRTIDGCLSITAFTLLCPGNTTPRFFPFRTSAYGFLISCCVSSIAAQENSSLAILALFKARCMSDCSSCNWPPCLAIVDEMLKTYKKLVAACRVRIGCYLNHIRLHSLL